MNRKQLLRLFILMTIICIIWESVSSLQLLPTFLLPSFSQVVMALYADFPLLLTHLVTTLIESISGLFISIILAVSLAIAMDYFPKLYDWLAPLLVISQTIPTIILAPLLVLWFGYGLLPKIILIILVCFFPLTFSLFNGFQQIDVAYNRLLKSYGATYWQTLRYVKIPFAQASFFSGLKIATSYAMISAVIAEWLGGESGLGVYMTRVRKAYAFDKLFAAMLLISFFSLFLMLCIQFVEHALQNKRHQPIKEKKNEKI